MLDPATSSRHLREEAFKGGLYLKAAKLYRQAREAAEKANEERWRVYCLFFEGVSLYLANRIDDAMPLLMEAASCRDPAVDLADVYNAATTLVDISLYRKSATYCRKLIQQSREYLVTARKENWRHKLDLLEGELEYYRGNFQDAYQCFLDGWNYEQKSSGYPGFTRGAYLRCLCKMAFIMRDKTALHRWVKAIEEATKEAGHRDKLFAKCARLYLFRAERERGSDFVFASEWALDTLASLDMFEMEALETPMECLRVLILARRWEEVDHRLSRYSFVNNFFGLIFLGDERLARARDALGLEMQDDEYDTEFLLPSRPGENADLERGTRFLHESRAHYERAQGYTKTRDERLETHWCTETLTERLRRLADLESFVDLGKNLS